MCRNGQTVVIVQQLDLNYKLENVIRLTIAVKKEGYPSALKIVQSIPMGPSDHGPSLRKRTAGTNMRVHVIKLSLGTSTRVHVLRK